MNFEGGLLEAEFINGLIFPDMDVKVEFVSQKASDNQRFPFNALEALRAL
jgi:hypothetical protein